MICPVCGRKTNNKIREDDVSINYSIYCPKCKQKTLDRLYNVYLLCAVE